MVNDTNIILNYAELKDITEKRILNRLKMKEQADQPYDYAMFHAQAQAIFDMWHVIAITGKAPPEQIASDYVYFTDILEPSRW